jgi:ribonuclease P protein component
MKKQRTVAIKRKEEMSLLLKNGYKWECSILNIYYLINKREYNRCAICVPKKTGTAVNRNKIKRIVREFLKKNKGTTPSHYDTLIRFHPKKLKIKTSLVEGKLKEWYANTEK